MNSAISKPATLPKPTFDILADQTLKLVVLISGRGSNLQALIDAIDSGYLDAKIVAVLSNNKDAKGLERAQSFDIPIFFVDPKQASTREDYDLSLIKIIAPFAPDLLVLAGYMRILSAAFVQEFLGKIINIHPSLLPAYKGLNTHQRVIDAKEAYHGATVHFVTEALDDGEIIIQSRIAILPNDTAESLQQRVLEEEHIIYPRAIQWIGGEMLGKAV